MTPVLTEPNQTSWGSRPDGDANDTVRMTPRSVRSASMCVPSTCGPLALTHAARFRSTIATRPERSVIDTRPATVVSSEKTTHKVRFPRLDVRTSGLDAVLSSAAEALLSPLVVIQTAPLLGANGEAPWRDVLGAAPIVC